MRLWHKDLIPVLPRQQLLGQWRECCLIAKNIRDKGTPNHILVNPIMDYPICHFIVYCSSVYCTMQERGYRADWSRFRSYFGNGISRYFLKEHSDVEIGTIFSGWHNEKYFKQCLANLEEKHDRGGITDVEWQTILNYIKRRYSK